MASMRVRNAGISSKYCFTIGIARGPVSSSFRILMSKLISPSSDVVTNDTIGTLALKILFTQEVIPDLRIRSPMDANRLFFSGSDILGEELKLTTKSMSL